MAIVECGGTTCAVFANSDPSPALHSLSSPTPMERSRTIFLKIASAAKSVITSANEYANRKDKCRIPRSHHQLEDEMKRISVACEGIADVLSKASLPDGPAVDIRLQDWLDTDEPEQCLDTLNQMQRLLLENEPSWGSWLFRGWATAPAGDKIEEAAQCFDSRKACFHFLSTTDIWNNEKTVQLGQDPAVPGESDFCQQAPSLAISVGINSILADPTIGLEGERAGFTTEESSDTFDRQDLSVSILRDSNTSSAIANLADQPNRDTVAQREEAKMTDEQRNKEEKKDEREKKLADIEQWLDGLNCAEKQDDTLSLRQPDTCRWLFDTTKYREWRDGQNPFLWLRGKPGAGKSVLASSVINALETSPSWGEILAFFYCDFRNDRSTNPAEALRSILTQLLRGLRHSVVNHERLVDDLSNAKERGGSTRKNSKELAEFVCRVAALSGEKPLVVVDALDECKDIRVLLQALMVIKDHVRLFVTSRPLHVIVRGLSGLPFISMDDMEAELSADIRLHVTRELDARHRLRDLDVEFKSEICWVLCDKAGGMFRWIQCSIDTLDRCVTRKEVRKALDNLPEGLDETYERILLEIDAKGREGRLARRALTWLVAAVRPLRLNELIEGLSINIATRTLDPDFGPMHHGALLDACGSLVVHNKKSGIVILSHFSVKEYLMGEFIPRHLSHYRINWKRANSELARACIYYLCIYLNSPFRNSSNTLVNEACSTLRDYAINDAIGHFQHLGSQFELVLYDIKVLARATQQHHPSWNNLCRSAKRVLSPTWPSSKHDLTLYMLVAFAPNSLLQTFLRHNTLTPKEGLNPLVYAAYFNKEAHAWTLLSRGARLNRRGWNITGLFQVFPIEVALQAGHNTMVTLFSNEGSYVPPQIFTKLLPPPHGTSFSIIKMLLETDDFAEVATNDQLGEIVHKSTQCLLRESIPECDLKCILQRFTQVLNGYFSLDTKLRLLQFTINTRCFSGTQLLLSHDPSLASLCMPKIFRERDFYAHASHGSNLIFHTTLQSFRWNQDDALETVKILVNHGFDPQQANPSGETLLDIAVNRGLLSVVPYLLSHSVSISPNTLHLVLELYNEQRAAFLLSCLLGHGADVHVRNTAGDSLLHVVLSWTFNGNQNDALKIVKMLIDRGCCPHEANHIGETPLRTSVRRGFVAATRHFLSLGIDPSPDLLHLALMLNRGQEEIMVACLLEYGANVHVCNAAGDPLLHAALKSFHCDGDDALKIWTMLVDQGCNLHEANHFGETPLDIAVKRGLFGVTRYLLCHSTSPPKSPDILHFALGLYNGEKAASMVTCLLKHGANVHIRNAAGDPLLHTVLKSFDCDGDDALKIWTTLVDHGCNLHEVNRSGETTLDIAVERGLLSIVRYLLHHGASPSPNTLHLALDLRDMEKRALMLACLLEHGANIHVCNAAGDPLLHAALRSLNWDEGDTLKIWGTLVDRGCDLHMASPSGETPLDIAIKRGLLTITQYLLYHSVSASPGMLHLALKLGLHNTEKRASMVACLLEHRADVHVYNAVGDPLLHAALKSFVWDGDTNDLETCKMLVDHGCNLHEANLSGETPLSIAVEKGLLSVTQYLLCRGASSSPNVLHLALGLRDTEKRTSMVARLLKHGIDVHICNAAGDPLLHAALNSFDPDGLGDADALETCRTLVDHGCNLHEVNSSGKTPLDIAVERGLLSVTHYLLCHGTAPSPNLLYLALGLPNKKRRARVVACLLEHGINARIHNAVGHSTFHAVLRSSPPWDEDGALETMKLLISCGGDPLETNSSGETVLHAAIQRGFVSVALYLLSLGIPPDPDLLHATVKLKSSVLTVSLLENGSDVHARDTAGNSVLHTALQSCVPEYDDPMEIVRTLVCHNCDPLAANSLGETPIYIAVRRGFVSVTRYLLSYWQARTPPSDVLSAALLPRDDKVQSQILRLLENGATIHTLSAEARDEMLSALSHSFGLLREVYHTLEILELLVDRGCNPLEPDTRGEIPLCVAVERGHIIAAKILLLLCTPFSTPCGLLWVVLISKQFHLKTKTIEFLIDQGADVHAKAPTGDSVLHVAIASIEDDSKALQVARLLLRRGCDPTVLNSFGTTPFHVAVERGRISVVKLFISQDVQFPPDILFTAIQSGATPRSGASHRRLEMIKVLVTAGCDVQTPNTLGLTPLDAAYREGHSDVVDYLLSTPASACPGEEL